MESLNVSCLFSRLGPGLLYAGAAIGVSHLVQSTRAGAEFGYTLIWVVIIANILKYPFFEYGPRYAASTGKNLIEGYRNIGKWAVWVFLIMTLGTMFIIQAAVTVVTAGLAANITGIVLPIWVWSAIILAVCTAILLVGRFSFLDKTMKVIIILLSIATIGALFMGFGLKIEKFDQFKTSFSFLENNHVLFLIALVGWMPAPLDISVWHSVWTLAKKDETNEGQNLKEALLDFRIGFWGTAFLAVCFLSLGCISMYGTGKEIEGSAVKFAAQLITIYTESLGKWSYPIIAFAAFTTMFSTSLTCLDAFPRVLSKTFEALKPKEDLVKFSFKNSYRIWLLVTAIGAVVLLAFFLNDMKTFIDLATTISFVTAPILALLNFIAIRQKEVPSSARPGKFSTYLSWAGLVFLFGFTLYFLKIRLF